MENESLSMMLRGSVVVLEDERKAFDAVRDALHERFPLMDAVWIQEEAELVRRVRELHPKAVSIDCQIHRAHVGVRVAQFLRKSHPEVGSTTFTSCGAGAESCAVLEQAVDAHTPKWPSGRVSLPKSLEAAIRAGLERKLRVAWDEWAGHDRAVAAGVSGEVLIGHCVAKLDVATIAELELPAVSQIADVVEDLTRWRRVTTQAFVALSEGERAGYLFRLVGADIPWLADALARTVASSRAGQGPTRDDRDAIQMAIELSWYVGRVNDLRASDMRGAFTVHQGPEASANGPPWARLGVNEFLRQGGQAGLRTAVMWTWEGV